MSYTSRIQYIIKTLIKKDGITLEEIADEFEISTRQAGRDIEFLRYQMGAPIKYDKRDRVYRLTQDWSSYTNLDDNLVILASYFRSLIEQLPIKDSIKKEIEETFLSSVSKNAAALVDKVIYKAPQISFPNYDVFSTVTEALTNNRCIEIDYSNFKKESTKRIVEPLRLINYSSSWYLVGFDHKRDKVINFHLSRVVKASILNKEITFKDSALIVDNSFGIFITGRTQDYVIKFSSELTDDVRHIIWHQKQRIEDLEDGSFLLHIPATNSQELITLVLRYAPYARPICPDSFVSEYKKRVEEINKTIEMF